MSTVLIVEDNDLNLKLFHDLLSIQNCNILTSKDGMDVMAIVEKNRPDLILMDIQLRTLSGLDIIKELKSNPDTSNIPIIVITAFALKSEEEIISESGCDVYLSKPVAIDLFFDALGKFIKLKS
jgi:two-component system, cell cycle response regulator DivK